MNDNAGHWGAVYTGTASTTLSWYQSNPAQSLKLFAAQTLAPDAPVLDVGGGTSLLVDQLLAAGYRDVTVLDIATEALANSMARLGERAAQVHWLTADVLDWVPPRRYQLWHDRAVFHFLTTTADRDRYRSTLDAALAGDGYAIIGTFADDGPSACSGLPTARYTPQQLAAQFPHLQMLRQEREIHHTPTGHTQPFTWLLLRRH